MLDIKEIRNDPEGVTQRLQSKVPDADISSVIDLDKELRATKVSYEDLKAKRNQLSSQIGTFKREGKNTDSLMKEVSSFGDLLEKLDEKEKELSQKYQYAISLLPNIPYIDTPVSADPKDNVCINEKGEKRTFSFPFKNHLELNEGLKLFDFERAASITGSGWPLYKGFGAQLEWALLQFMVQFHIEKGYTFILPPILAKEEALYAAGQLPKFHNQQFKVDDEHYHLYLNPTSEVLLNSLHHGEILSEEDLPIRYTAYTPCFRREAGAAGSLERGLIRTHQFNKVEMFCFTAPEQSEVIFAEMLRSAEGILEALELHYRSMLLVTGDMSFGAAKTVDVEIWLPGQDRYYEVSSISNCTDFQTRRSKVRYKKDGKMIHPHTLNGSGLATSRLMVGILENNQNEDGSVNIPKVLRPYLGGKDKLTPGK